MTGRGARRSCNHPPLRTFESENRSSYFPFEREFKTWNLPPQSKQSSVNFRMNGA